MICTNCGKELKEQTRFCPYCGKAVGSDAVNAAKNEILPESKKNPAEKTVTKGMICIVAAMAIIAALVCISIYNATGRRMQRQLELGRKYLENQQYDEARLAFEKVIEMDNGSECIEAYAGLVEVYVHMDDADGRKKFYGRVLDIVRGLDEGKFAGNMDYITEIYSAADKIYGDEPAKASEFLEEGLEIVGDGIEIKRNLAENYFKQAKAYEQESDYEKSLEIYDRLLELEEEDGQALASLEACLSIYLNDLTESGKYDKASELTEKYRDLVTGIDYEEILARKDTDNGEMGFGAVNDLRQSDTENTDGVFDDWNSAYWDFILNWKFMTSGQDYGYDYRVFPGYNNTEYVEERVSLYDFDKDGTPELLITNGYMARTERWAYIYTYENGKIKYLGIGPTDSFCIKDSEYNGIWGCYGGGEYNWTYYWKDGDVIGSEYVFQENTWDNAIIQETDDDKLFAESQKEKISLYQATPSEIIGIGWKYYVVLTGI